MPMVNQFERIRSSIVYAHSSVLCLGMALIFWGLAPAVIERIVTKEAPDMLVFLAGTSSIVMGGLCVALHVFIRRGARWAVWAGFGTSLTLIAGWFVGNAFSSERLMSLVIPLLAAATTIATWVVIRFNAHYYTGIGMNAPGHGMGVPDTMPDGDGHPVDAN